MNYAVGAIKAALVPGSVPFLLLGTAIGVLLLYGSERSRVWGRRWLAALVAGYWLLSLPPGAALVVATMGWGHRPIASATEAQEAMAVIVLDASTLRFRAAGGALDTVSAPSAYRAIEGARVYRLLGEPLVFVSSGSDEPRSPSSPEGGALRSELVRAGVSPERIVMETGSNSTRAQALNLAALLRTRGIKRAVLVTSPTHIARGGRTRVNCRGGA